MSHIYGLTRKPLNLRFTKNLSRVHTWHQKSLFQNDFPMAFIGLFPSFVPMYLQLNTAAANCHVLLSVISSAWWRLAVGERTPLLSNTSAATDKDASLTGGKLRRCMCS